MRIKDIHVGDTLFWRDPRYSWEKPRQVSVFSTDGGIIRCRFDTPDGYCIAVTRPSDLATDAGKLRPKHKFSRDVEAGISGFRKFNDAVDRARTALYQMVDEWYESKSHKKGKGE